MRYLVAKDRKRRALFAKSEMKQTVFKILRKNKLFAEKNKTLITKIKKYYRNSPRDQFYSRIRARCVVSGKSGWIFTRLKVSGMQLREMYGKGYFYGFKNSSW